MRHIQWHEEIPVRHDVHHKQVIRRLHRRLEQLIDDQGARPDLPFIRITARVAALKSETDFGKKEQGAARKNHTLLRRALGPYGLQPGEEFGMDEVDFELRVQGRVAHAVEQEARIHVAHDRQQRQGSEGEELTCQNAREIRHALRDLSDGVVHDQRRTIVLTLPSVTQLLHG